MPFTIFRGIGDVLKKYQIVLIEIDFVLETEITISDTFGADLNFSLRELVFDNS